MISYIPAILFILLVLISLGEVLKTYRTNCKMTQEFVAESLGVSRQAVSKWENGTSQVLRI